MKVLNPSRRTNSFSCFKQVDKELIIITTKNDIYKLLSFMKRRIKYNGFYGICFNNSKVIYVRSVKNGKFEVNSNDESKIIEFANSIKEANFNAI